MIPMEFIDSSGGRDTFLSSLSRENETQTLTTLKRKNHLNYTLLLHTLDITTILCIDLSPKPFVRNYSGLGIANHITNERTQNVVSLKCKVGGP